MHLVVVHNTLMTGPPGAGKTLIAKSLPGILPRMSIDEALEVTKIYSVADLLPADLPLMRHRPFQTPYHTTILVFSTLMLRQSNGASAVYIS